MKDSVKDIGQQLLAQAETMAPAEGSGHSGANDDFPVGKGKDVGGGRVPQMDLVQAAAFLR